MRKMGKMRRTTILFGSLAVLVLSVTAAGAGMVKLTPSKDNSLYETLVGGPLNGELSNGAGPNLFAGRTDDGPLRRALLAFDVAGGIPPGARIVQVDLALTVSAAPNASPQPFELHRVLADWGEGASVSVIAGGGMGTAATTNDATWIHRFFPDPLKVWANPGGDFATGMSATQTTTGLGRYHWTSTPAAVADVQAWLDDPANNFGWLVLGNEATTLTARRFNSRENSDRATHPVLTIAFTQGSAVPAASRRGLVFIAFALVFIGAARLWRIGSVGR